MLLPANVLEFFGIFQTGTYIHVSSATLLIIDWFYTLELEATYAWNPPWNMGTVLFFLTKYLVFSDTFLSLHRQLAPVMSVDACTILYTTEGWLIGFGMFIAELILTIRVWAIWERTRNIKIFLVLISVITCSAGLIGYAIYGAGLPTVSSKPPAVPASWCFAYTANVPLEWAYLALLIHQTIISIMTIVKGIQHYRMGSYNMSLIHTFYEDGASYYIIMIALSIANLVILHENSALLISIQRVFHSILTARMLLNLRQAASTLEVGGQNFRVMLSKEPDTLDQNINYGLTGANHMPVLKSRRSRIEGWFGNQDLVAHQQHMWMDPEASMWALKN